MVTYHICRESVLINLLTSMEPLLMDAGCLSVYAGGGEKVINLFHSNCCLYIGQFLISYVLIV